MGIHSTASRALGASAVSSLDFSLPVPQTSTWQTFDLVNRDPNSINDHLKVTFEDLLAEPEGAHSMDCVWKFSYKCFNCWKDLCYMLMTLCCGICMAAEWGCEFAHIAFCHIWMVTPCFKVLELNCGCCQKLYGMCVHCCLDPWMEAFALCCSAFKKS